MSRRGESVRQYQWAVAGVSAVAALWCAAHLPVERLDLRFLLLAVVAVGVSSRVAVKIPRQDINITLSDAFVFLAVLLYGGEAAVLLAATEGVFAGFRISRQKKPVTILFNGGVAALSTFAAVCAARAAFGPLHDLSSLGYGPLVAALGIMASAQYLANSVLIAVGMALKNGEPVRQTWSRHCVWSSVSHFFGACAAGLSHAFINSVGFYAFLVTVPIIRFIHFTYDKYLEDIKATAALAEQAERARAEAERARAELAEQHVEEQRRYIVEMEQARKELEESREHFRHAAFHDSLTGLPNRALLTDHLRLSIERARRRAEHIFAVLFLDLDRFKNINDSLGHAAGDRLLVEVARRLESCLRPTDTVARLGGDEFAILLDGLDDEADAVRIAGRVQEELALPLYLNGHDVYTTASVGITLCTGYYEDPENILRDADTAMYYAKENGKARIEMFDSVMHASVMARLQLENDLRRAIENEEFLVYYQPVVALRTGRITGFEALVRWRHPERGFIPPDAFIPLAEETGLITEIGAQVLREACRRMCQFATHSHHTTPLTMSVNLSSKQFAQPDLLDRIQRVLRETGLDPRALKLEITESAVMENTETAASMLKCLRELGIQLSIDDFGTGYSSLSYLHRFPVDTLKIDRSFVSRMDETDENAEIVRTIAILAGNLGMSVVAEGVETYEQYARLRELRCEYGQGYLFSRPVPAEVALELLTDNQQMPWTPAAAPARILEQSLTVVPENVAA